MRAAGFQADLKMSESITGQARQSKSNVRYVGLCLPLEGEDYACLGQGDQAESPSPF